MISSQTRSRRGLAHELRAYAKAEREHRLHGDVVEFAPLAERTALYGEIAALLDDLLAESPGIHDYGAMARARDERVASLLAALRQGE